MVDGPIYLFSILFWWRWRCAKTLASFPLNLFISVWGQRTHVPKLGKQRKCCRACLIHLGTGHVLRDHQGARDFHYSSFIQQCKYVQFERLFNRQPKHVQYKSAAATAQRILYRKLLESDAKRSKIMEACISSPHSAQWCSLVDQIQTR